MRIPHSKRFAATVDQLVALRGMVERFVAAHWREHHHKAIEQRRAAGDRLIAVQPPNVRLDHTMAMLHGCVERAWREHYSPALPETTNHGWRA